MASPMALQALELLGTLLNERYGAPIVKLYETTWLTAGAPHLEIARGATPDDVIVAVSVSGDDPGGRYVIAAFTSSGWHEYGEAFITVRKATVTGAMDAICAYIPVTPPH